MDMSARGYEPIAVNQIPKDANGNCATSLYIYMPTVKKFIVFVPAGEKFTYAKKSALERYLVPALFIRSDFTLEPVVGGSDDGHEKNDFDVLGENANAELNNMFKTLSENPDLPADKAIEQLETMASKIINIIAPDVDNLKAKMIENTQYLWIMNDAAAITSIAVMIAAANGVDSKKPLRDMVCAALIMDFSLAKLSKDVTDQYIADPNKLSKELREKYEQHPVEAYQLAKRTLKQFNDAAYELILSHHELNNGKGYPRRIRSNTLFPLSRVFSLAVDTFETLKRSSMAQSPKTLNEVFLMFKEENVEIHVRRHQKKIVDKTIEYLQIK